MWIMNNKKVNYLKWECELWFMKGENVNFVKWECEGWKVSEWKEPKSTKPLAGIKASLPLASVLAHWAQNDWSRKIFKTGCCRYELWEDVKKEKCIFHSQLYHREKELDRKLL